MLIAGFWMMMGGLIGVSWMCLFQIGKKDEQV
jgi:hypothetical protein